MVTAYDLAGTLGVDWSPFQAGLDAAYAYAQAWGVRTSAALALRLTVDTTSLAGASAGLDAVTAGATQAAAAQTSAGAAGQTLAAGLASLASQATAAGTGVEGLGAQALTAEEALAALSAQSAGAQANMAGFTGGLSAESAALAQATAEMAAMTGAHEALSAAQVSSAGAAEASAAADAALVQASLALAEAETTVSQGADLAAAASRNLATTMTAENEQILVATANLNANADANERAALAMTQTETRTAGASGNLGLLAIGVGLAGAAVTRMGADFDASASKLVGFAGVSAQELGQVQQAALGLERQTGVSAQAIVDGFYYAKSAGLSLADAMTVVDASTRLAQAGFTDTRAVVDVTTSAMRAYGVGADQLTHIQDVLVATTTAGKLQFGELSGELGKDLSVAATAGISLEQLGASIATMTQKGIPAAQATTAFRATVLELEAPSAKTAAALQSIGLSADEVRASIRDRGLLATLTDLDQRAQGNIGTLHDIFSNVRALSGVLADVGQSTTDYRESLDQTTSAHGRAAVAISTYADTSQAAIKRFAGEAKADLTAIGSDVAGVVATLGRIPPPAQQAVITFGLITAATFAAGGAYSALGPLVLSVGGSFQALAADIGLVTVAEEAATASVLPAWALIAGIAAAATVAIHGFSSGNDDAAAAQQRLADATAKSTTEVTGFVQALRQENVPAADILDQLNQKMIAAETVAGQARTRLADLGDELQLAKLASAGSAQAMGILNDQFGQNITTTGQAKALVGQLNAEQGVLNQTITTATADAGQYGTQFKELTIAEQQHAAAQQQTLSAVDQTIAKYGVATDASFALGSARKALVDILRQEADGTLSAAAVNAAYASSARAAADPTTDWKDRTKELTAAQKEAGPEQQQALALQLDMDKVLRGLPASYSSAVTGMAGLTAAAGVQSSTLADNAGHLKDLDDAVNKERSSTVEAAVVQQQLSQARQFASQSSDQQKSSLAALQLLIDTSTGSTRAYYEEQQKLDLAYQALGPDAANAAVAHQQLANAFGISKDKAADLRDQLPDLLQDFRDGTITATDFGNALLGIFAKPDQAELQFKAKLADLKSQLADLNAVLANGSYAERHIAELEKVVLQDQATGASTDKLAKDKQALDLALANASPAAQAGKALADHAFALEQDQKATQASLDKETTHRESMGATVTAQQALSTGTALTTGQMVTAYQTYETGVTGTLTTVHDTAVTQGTATGRDATAAVASSLSAGNPAMTQAGSENATHYHDALTAELDVTKTDATNAAAQLAGSITQPDAFTKAGDTDGQAFGAALLGQLRAAMQQAASTVRAGGASIAGVASAAGAPGGTLPPAGTSGYLSATQLASGLSAAGLPQNALSTMVAILLAESGGSTTAGSAAGAYGFGQLMPGFAGISDAMRTGQSPEALQAQFQAIVRGYMQSGGIAGWNATGRGPWDPYSYVGGGNPAVNYGEINVGPGQGSFTAFLPQAQSAVAALGQAGAALTTAATDLAGTGTGGGPFGGSELPAAGPDMTPKQEAAFANQETRLGGTVEADTTRATAAIDQLAQRITEVTETQVPAAFQHLASEYVSSAQTAEGAWSDVAAAADRMNADIAAGADKATIDSDAAFLDSRTKIATADQSAADKSYSAWNKVAGELSKDQQAAATDTDKLGSALDALGAHSQDVALGQQQHATALGTAYQTAATTATTAWGTVDTDVTALNQAMANGADDATLRHLRTQLDSDTRIAESASKTAGTAYSRWHSSYQEIDTDLKAISADSDKAGTQLSTMADHSAEMTGREAQHATGLATVYQDAAAKAGASWNTVLGDIAALQDAVARGASTFELQQLRTTLQVDAGIAEDQSKTADKAYTTWKTAADRIDAAWKQLQADTRTGAEQTQTFMNDLAAAGAQLGITIVGLPSTVDQLTAAIAHARDVLTSVGTAAGSSFTQAQQQAQQATNFFQSGFVAGFAGGMADLDRLWNAQLTKMPEALATWSRSTVSVLDFTATYGGGLFAARTNQLVTGAAENAIQQFTVFAANTGGQAGVDLATHFNSAIRGYFESGGTDVSGFITSYVAKALGPAAQQASGAAGKAAGITWVEGYSGAFTAAFGSVAAHQADELLGIATAAVDAWQDGRNRLLAIDQQLTDPGLSTENARRLTDERTTLTQGVDLAGKAAQDSLKAYQQYTDGVKQANQAILSDRAGMFDAQHKLDHLSQEEQRVGLAGALADEIHYYQQLMQLEYLLTQATDANVQARLRTQVDATSFLLAQAKEHTRELEVAAQDLVNSEKKATDQATEMTSTFTVGGDRVFLAMQKGAQATAAALGSASGAANQLAQDLGVSATAADAAAVHLAKFNTFLDQTTTSATSAGQALSGMLSQPSSEEAQWQAKLADLNERMAQYTLSVARGAPANAALEASFKQQQAAIQAEIGVLKAHRDALSAHVAAQEAAAGATNLSMAQMESAYVHFEAVAVPLLHHVADTWTTVTTAIKTNAAQMDQSLTAVSSGFSDISTSMGKLAGSNRGMVFNGFGGDPSVLPTPGSFQHGGLVPQDMLAFVHAGEYVLPAALVARVAAPNPAPPSLSGGGGGLPQVTLNIHDNTFGGTPDENAAAIRRSVRAEIEEIFGREARLQ